MRWQLSLALHACAWRCGRPMGLRRATTSRSSTGTDRGRGRHTWVLGEEEGCGLRCGRPMGLRGASSTAASSCSSKGSAGRGRATDRGSGEAG